MVDTKKASNNIDEIGSGDVTQPAPADNKRKRSTELEVVDAEVEPQAGKRKSDVWLHFTKPSVSNGIHTCACLYCGKVYRCHPKTNGTSTLKTHSEKCKENPTNQTNDSKQKKLSFKYDKGGLEGFPKPWSFDQKVCRDGLAKMIILNELPFRFVESQGFRLLMSKCCPMFHIPCRTTVHKDVMAIYANEKLSLKQSLKIGSPRVSLTTDTWTSNQQINYMCLTAYYIDDNWILQKRILNFCPISSHKGEDIGKAVEKCLLEWEIDRVMCVTVDNASSNDTAISYLKKKLKSPVLGHKHMHMRCIAHIINLIVTDGLSMLGNLVEKVRAAVRYIRQSPNRLEKFKKCVESLNLESKALLCLDVPTRWNSTYLMLNAASNLQAAFGRFEIIDPFIALEPKSKKRNSGERETELVGMPTENDWEEVKRLVKFLYHFYDLTKRVSGSQYITSNLQLDGISDTYEVLQKGKLSDDLQLIDISERMMQKYNKYWGNIEKLNMMIYIAPVFDPRHKLEFVIYVIDRIYDCETADKLKKQVVDSLNELFKEYKDMYRQYSSTIVDLTSQSSLTVPTPKNSKTESIESTKAVMASDFKKYKSNKDGLAKSELDRYLKDEFSEEDDDNFKILDWWKINSARYPILSLMARDILSIPISTVSSESAFSTGGRVLDDFRSSMIPSTVQVLICCQDWLKTPEKPRTLEDDHIELAQLEKECSKQPMEASLML